jgi:sodium/bile acid cotransporter 7
MVIVSLCVGGCGSPPVTDEDKSARLGEMVDDILGLFPDVQTISVAEVGRLIEKDSIVLIDVREARERAVSVIPGAISAEEFEADPARYADVAAVAYCTIGHRSSEYAQRLSEEGHDVLNLTGSILAWTHAGGPLVSDDGSTNRLHVYGERWNLAPERYETIW